MDRIITLLLALCVAAGLGLAWDRHGKFGWHWHGPFGWHPGFDLPDSLATERDKALAELADMNARATMVAQQQGAVTASAEKAAVQHQAQIQVRYRTIIQKVPLYVTPEADADCALPVGAVVLLDAAAAGTDPDGVSFAAGQSHDTRSSLTCSQLVGAVADNYGLSAANSRQLNDLQAWVRAEKAANP